MLMLSNYEYKQACTVVINSADDNTSSKQITDIDIYSTYELGERTYVRTRPAFRREITCHLTRSRKKGDPLVMGIADALSGFLKINGNNGRSYWSPPKKFKIAIVFPNVVDEANGGPMILTIEKKDPYYYLMNNRMTKKNMMVTIARTVYRSCFEDNAITLMQYMFNMIILPENVKYALENRTPYFFIRDPFNREGQRERIEVRLNTEMISPSEAALEISDGVWAPISVKDLDIFINFHYHNHKRSTKWMLSPKGLWKKLIGSEPTESQVHLMMEFLTQNRTSDLIEERAQQLMKDLVTKYPDRIRIVKYLNHKKKEITAMLVRGKMADWIIIDSEYKTQIQKVKTYVYISSEVIQYDLDNNYRHDHNEFESGVLRGPICIDNVHTNTSLGDQYAARALALLNDKMTVKLVNTIARYIPKIMLDGDRESRFQFEEITGEMLNDKLGSVR